MVKQCKFMSGDKPTKTIAEALIELRADPSYNRKKERPSKEQMIEWLVKTIHEASIELGRLDKERQKMVKEAQLLALQAAQQVAQAQQDVRRLAEQTADNIAEVYRDFKHASRKPLKDFLRSVSTQSRHKVKHFDKLRFYFFALPEHVQKVLGWLGLRSHFGQPVDLDLRFLFQKFQAQVLSQSRLTLEWPPPRPPIERIPQIQPNAPTLAY